MMKKIFAGLIVVVMSCTFSGCNFFQGEPSESPASPQSSLENEMDALLSSEDLVMLQKQAERLTDCLVSHALTPEMRKAVLAEGKLMLSAAEAEMVDELAWYFMLAAPLYREDLDFPYATLAQLSEDGYTFYFPIHNAQQMTSQLFGRENWLPEIAHPYYHEDAARFEKPTETGVYTAYGCTEMESTVEPDNHITVTFQLIDTPAYPGLERYGRHRFDFAVCQGEEGPYLQLQSCEFIEPAVPLPPEPPDNQIDRSSLPPEISQSPDLPTADTIYHYHVPNPKSLDLEALIANFSRLDQEKDILTKLPDSYVLQESQESGVKRILSKGWSFAGTEGILIADYTTDPTTTETKNDTLLRVDYWTLNYDLEMFR